MLCLFCLKFDGNVVIKDFDSCAVRDEFANSLVRAEYRHVIEVNGSFDFVEPPHAKD